uniref:Uncharacterized protein n=1 Tax=Arundo donax TaxID=35708 RepID=A0A0A8YC12_ARUDO
MTRVRWDMKVQKKGEISWARATMGAKNTQKRVDLNLLRSASFLASSLRRSTATCAAISE